MNFIITQELAQALVNYLQVKPFQEVHDLIGRLQKLNPHDSALDKMVLEETTETEQHAN
tara:strand:+ start:718 stop:894 length:177 start_codon:yes stop_codon:yes gene_type:complete